MVCAAAEKCPCPTHMFLFPGSVQLTMQVDLAKPLSPPGSHSFPVVPRPLANGQCLGEAGEHPATWGPADNLQVGLLQSLQKQMTLALPLIPHQHQLQMNGPVIPTTMHA